jgi:ATP-dependent 26S proteasome regulatory subunit
VAVQDLFAVNKRGIVFFDDMDIALRDRNTVRETDDQAVFLSALDGIEVNEGVAYVFTTNCPLQLIDPAFKRPGRIDLVMHFEVPDAVLRRELFDRWHSDIHNGIDIDIAVKETSGLSFAEIEEIKNLLILH